MMTFKLIDICDQCFTEAECKKLPDGRMLCADCYGQPKFTKRGEDEDFNLKGAKNETENDFYG